MDHGILLSDSILDVPGTLTRLAGDQSLFVDLIDFFVVDAPQYMSELQRAADTKDFAQARWKAHALKGLVAGCGGTRAAGAAQNLEAAAQADGSEDLQPLIATLQKEVDLLRQSLLSYRAQIAADINPGSRPR